MIIIGKNGELKTPEELFQWKYKLPKEIDKVEDDKFNSQKLNYVFEKLSAAGIEVVKDKTEFEKILGEENILQKLSDFSRESKLTSKVKDIIIESLKNSVEPFVPTIFTRENYQKIFKDGNIETPVETVRIGPNQFVKLCPANRNNLMLAVRRTLESPSLVLEKETFDEKTETFKPVHVYGKSFINTINNHTKTVESVIVFKEGKNIAMSFHNKDIAEFVNQIKTVNDIIYIDNAVNRAIAFDSKVGDNHVMKEVQDFLSSLEQKFLPLNKKYNRNFVLSTEDFINQNQVQTGNLEITQENFDKYFNIFNRHDLYKNNPNKIASELFNYHVSENNKEIMRKWLTEEGYTLKEKTKLQNMVLDNGKTYGFAYEGKIYLNPEIMNSEVAVHEYTHLWDNYTQKTNPELWQKGKDIFKGTSYWYEVKYDPNYADIKNNDDLVLSEIHSRICGELADAVLTKIAEKDGVITKDKAIDWDEEVFRYILTEFQAGRELDDFDFRIDEEKDFTENLMEFLAQPMKDLMQGKIITNNIDNNVVQKYTSDISKEKDMNKITISDIRFLKSAGLDTDKKSLETFAFIKEYFLLNTKNMPGEEKNLYAMIALEGFNNPNSKNFSKLGEFLCGKKPENLKTRLLTLGYLKELNKKDNLNNTENIERLKLIKEKLMNQQNGFYSLLQNNGISKEYKAAIIERALKYELAQPQKQAILNMAYENAKSYVTEKTNSNTYSFKRR